MAYRRHMLVEGRDDQHVIRNLLWHYDIPCILESEARRVKPPQNEIVIEPMGGVQRLLEAASQMVRLGEQLAIVIDADTDLDGRWQAVQHTLREAGEAEFPQTPDPQGTIVTVRPPYREVKVGIWLMPDNTLPGILENFIHFLVPPADTLFARARKSVASIPRTARRFPAERQAKAEIHTWLAWQEEPGEPLGQAVTARYLDANAPHAQQLVGWVRRTFEL